MNAFRLFVAVASLISAAAHPEAGGIDKQAVLRIIQDGDHPEELAAAFNGLWSDYYLYHFSGFLVSEFFEMINHGRTMSLEHCLPQIRFSKQSHRDYFISTLVRCAFAYGNMDIADFLRITSITCQGKNFYLKDSAMGSRRRKATHHSTSCACRCPSLRLQGIH
jgi:hypothetical protein